MDSDSLIGVEHLRRLYDRAMESRAGRSDEKTERDWVNDNIVMCGLGMPLEVTISFLLSNGPSFGDFEKWVLDLNGGSIKPLTIDRINAAVNGTAYGPAIESLLSEIETADDVLTAVDLAFWEENGYVIVRNAIPPDDAKASETLVWEHLGMSPDDPASWYGRPVGKGIMMELYHHEILENNRRSKRIRKAFAQLWRDADLWATTDRTSFNPPEMGGYTFQGPNLHWDMSLAEPHYFGTQGILYLCDTDADQGAFTCVPGFNRDLGQWLDSLSDRSAARQIDLSERAVPVAANAGDLVIWHQYLPHGASPNRGRYPRIAQYINMFPTKRRENMDWA